MRKLSMITGAKIIIRTVRGQVCFKPCKSVSDRYKNMPTPAELFAVYSKYLEAMWDRMIVANILGKPLLPKPTAWSSRSSKILERMRRRSGTVMMRTKGNAREAAVDFTTHRATMHASWVMVNMFMRHVLTWRNTHILVRGLETRKLQHRQTYPEMHKSHVWLHLVENSASSLMI